MSQRAFMCAAALLFAAVPTTAASGSRAQEKTSITGSRPSAKTTTKAASEERAFTGWVTDTKCGVKGASAKHADCLKKCLSMGQKYALYDRTTKKLYNLDPQDKVADHGAQFIRVKGTLDGDTIHVASVTEAAPKKAAAKKAPAKTTKQF